LINIGTFVKLSFEVLAVAYCLCHLSWQVMFSFNLPFWAISCCAELSLR
jgi:hypothetical protein